MKPAYLRGLGFWTTGYANPEAWSKKEPDPGVTKPDASRLEGVLRRRASFLTRSSVEVFDQAIVSSGMDSSVIHTVWGTAHGEHDTAIKLLKMMRRGEGKLSPTHFHNSVHNTPSAYASISDENRSGSTTLTGGPELVASCFLEAFCLMDSGVPEVVIVLADEPLQVPFARGDMLAPLAIAFALSSEPDGAIAILTDLRRERLPASKPHDSLGGYFVAGALPMLERAISKQPGRIALDAPLRLGVESLSWCLDLQIPDLC